MTENVPNFPYVMIIIGCFFFLNPNRELTQSSNYDLFFFNTQNKNLAKTRAESEQKIKHEIE